MKEKTLGRTGLNVKIIGFGGIPIQRVTEQEAIDVVRRCHELGVNYFDTARRYTVSEERVGKALEGVRDEVYLATKSISRTKKEVLKDLEISLGNLRTDWIDVFQLHNISSSDVWKQVKAPDGALEALYEAYDMGKIRHLGFTSHNPSLAAEIVKEDTFETLMIPFNYLTTAATEVLLSLCSKMNVGTVIMKSFAGGALTDSNVALKYVLRNECVDIVIPGMNRTSEVEENVAVASASLTLTAEELGVIENDRSTLKGQLCHSCDYCQPCKQKINISFVLNAETILKRIGWTSFTEEQYQDAKVKVPTCIKCGDCETRCPYHLQIRELLPVRLEHFDKNRK